MLLHILCAVQYFFPNIDKATDLSIYIRDSHFNDHGMWYAHVDFASHA